MSVNFVFHNHQIRWPDHHTTDDNHKDDIIHLTLLEYGYCAIIVNVFTSFCMF